MITYNEFPPGLSDQANDAEFGRYYKFNATHSGFVLPLRSYFIRDISGLPWRDLSIGFIYRNAKTKAIGDGTADSTHDNDNLVAEELNENDVANLFHFGLTTSEFTYPGGPASVPVANNPHFLGLRGVATGISRITLSPLELAQLRLTLVTPSSTTLTGLPIQLPLKQGAGSNPLAMIGIRFVIDPITRVMLIKVVINTTVAVPNDAAGSRSTFIRHFLEGIPLPTVGSNEGTFAFPMATTFYSTFFIFWPYIANRLMLHGFGAIKST